MNILNQLKKKHEENKFEFWSAIWDSVEWLIDLIGDIIDELGND